MNMSLWDTPSEYFQFEHPRRPFPVMPFLAVKSKGEAKPFINKYSKRGDEFWSSEKECYEVNQDFLPEVTFENSPMEVELKLIEK